ncbi:ribonuclease III [Aspergillus undulatus]|uniref:ribonuclease III n=1 Tax=Aspergillus undulatus TaxID=1810928 RepID=UPI003CCE22B3
MDRKRKSIFASHCEDSVTSARPKRKHDRNLDIPSSQTSKSDLLTDLQTINILLGKVTSNAENSGTKLSPELARAAQDLSLALQHKPTSSNPHTKLNDQSYVWPLESLQRSSGSLPPLPSIIDDELEKAVFTHPGMSKHPKTTYDRLEILGDAYIELFSTKLIWGRFQQIPSGRISQIRELLVKNETLAEYATQYGLDRRALIPSEVTNQPKRWIKTKGDIFEAYVAAVILSHPDGVAVAESWLSELWSPTLEALEDSHESHTHSPPKQELARKLSGKRVKLIYIDEKAPIQHEGGKQTFFIGVYLTGWGWSNKHLGSGRGLNKTIAGNNAAQQALENKSLMKDIIASKAMHGLGTD